MALNTFRTIGNVYELTLSAAQGDLTNLDPKFADAVNNNFDVTNTSGVYTVEFQDSSSKEAFFNALMAGNNGQEFDGDTETRVFVGKNVSDDALISRIKTYLNGAAGDQFTIDGASGDLTAIGTAGSEGSEGILNFFTALATDDSIYATVFDLNNMSDMSVVPADNYAIALEELRAVGNNSSMGIAELTQATTDVQVESGKLEMINGVIKNAVNYLNTRARALTS